MVQVVTTIQRNGEQYMRAVESKRLSLEEISKVIDGKPTEQTTLITDKHPSCKSFAKENKSIKHRTVLAKDHVSKETR